jgi:hypothetical protein
MTEKKPATSQRGNPTSAGTPPVQNSDGMPGGRAALPAGSLSKPFLGPQGDENRTPPADAPVPPSPAARLPASSTRARRRQLH